MNSSRFKDIAKDVCETGRLSGKVPNKANTPKGSEESLKVTSIFLSVDGEVNQQGQGAWSVFIRLAGCSAGCKFCDTKYSWKGGEAMTVDEIIEKVDELGGGTTKITITGGEPMEQEGPALQELIRRLFLGHQISVETNGLHDVKPMLGKFSFKNWSSPNLSFVLDYKLPSAGKVNTKMQPWHYHDLPASCFIKFVVSNKNDFDWAMEVVKALQGKTKARKYFSPAEDGVSPEQLFKWMKDANCHLYKVGYNLQLHKFIFESDWRDEEE